MRSDDYNVSTYLSRSLSCMLAWALKAERPRQPRFFWGPWPLLDSGEEVVAVPVVSSPERWDSSRMSSAGASMVGEEEEACCRR